MRLEGRRTRTRINVSSSGNTTIISAVSPGIIEIDYISIVPSGGANTIGFIDGSTTMFSFALDDNQGFTYENSSGDYPIVLSNNSAFVLNLSAASQVDGFVLYRVRGENI